MMSTIYALLAIMLGIIINLSEALRPTALQGILGAVSVGICMFLTAYFTVQNHTLWNFNKHHFS